MSDSAGQSPHTLTPEGGHVALVGYLQQMLGGAQDYVRWLEPKRSTADGGFETLLAFEPEAFDQDFVATASDARGRLGRTLTQYKYSLHPEQYPIPPVELDEIIDALRDGARKANSTKVLPARFVLRTNRRLSRDSERLRVDAAAAALGRGQSELLSMKTTRKKVKNGWETKRVPRDAEAIKALAELDYDAFDPAKAVSDLQAYARSFGVYTTAELDEGVSKVIQLLFGAATAEGGTKVTPAQFEQALVGFRKPRRPTVKDLSPMLTKQLDGRRASVLGVEPPVFLVPREAAEELGALADEALVVLTGNGGCGKSVVLWEALTAAAHAPDPERRLAAVVTDADAREGLSGLVASWRTSADVPPGADADDTALQRLVQANPGVLPPVLLLGLDGIDEAANEAAWRARAARLVRFFWALHNDTGVPPARLLVTCRTARDVEQFIESKGGHGVRGRRPKLIPVGEFSDRELVLLCQRTPGLRPEVADLLRRAIPAAPGGAPGSLAPARMADPYSTDTLGYGSAAPVPPGASAALRTVRHPIVWHCFTEMPADEQGALLDGSAAALDLLASRYVDWFVRRACSRRGWEADDVRGVLGAVARHCKDAEAAYITKDWIGPASDFGWAASDSGRLFREAVSSGLVDEVAGAGGESAGPAKSWRWRHAFALRHLSNL